MALHDVRALLNDVEKSHRIVTASTDPRARKTGSVSTGLLSLDLFLGGGYVGGAWYTFYGGEQSAKSTSVSTAMAMLAAAGVPGTYWDYEGCIPQTEKVMLSDGKEVPLSDLLGTDLINKARNGNLVEGTKYPLPDTYQVVSAKDAAGTTSSVFYKGIRPLHTFELQNGTVFTGNEHPILVARSGCLMYIRQEELRTGDQVVVKDFKV